MKILITGGAGFVGSNAAKRFLDQGWEGIIIDDLSRAGSRKNLEWLGIKGFMPQSITESRVLDFAMKEVQPDVVLHLAAQVAVTTSVADPRRDFEVNALGTLNLLEAVRKHCPKATVIYSSTNKVYGQIDHCPESGISEVVPVDFHSPYGCSKGAADQYVRDYARIYGLSTVVLRQSCIYGTRQMGCEDQGWLAHFAIQAAQGKPITIYGDGNQVRDVLWVDDLLDCYQACIDRIQDVRGEVFNIGGGPGFAITLQDALTLIGFEKGHKPLPIKFADVRPGDQTVYTSNIEKARSRLGWEPKTRPQDGLKTLFSWVKDNLELFQGV